jgi:hypothetical protein
MLEIRTMPNELDTLTEDAALAFAEQGIADYDAFDYQDDPIELCLAA